MTGFSLATTVMLALLLVVSGDAAALKRPFDCDPCIDRPTYVIRAIVHGKKSSGFWQQVRSAALQAAVDMRVDFQMELYDEFDDEKMAQDIIDLSTGPNAPDALIVSIPSPRVQQAVSTALQYVPVFGINSGYEVASKLELIGFVSMDEYQGGVAAAREFLKQKNVTNTTQFLFVNHEKGNSALQRRLDGFRDTLDAEVEELIVDPDSDMASMLKDALEGCDYDAVLLASSFTLEYITSAMSQNGCSLGNILLGTFDTNANVYGAIAVGKLSFAISQQQHLQGAFSVVMASLYVTTGKKVVPSSDSSFGFYSSGPTVINLRNLPPDTLQSCEDEAFPVCSDTKADLEGGVSQSRCGCTERSKIKIAGVTHAAETDFFWDSVYSAAFQAAADMHIELKLDRLVLENDDLVATKMANKIIAYCQEGVDGLFVTIVNEDVVPAISECLKLNVPVLSINTGFSVAENLKLMHHIAQLEYAAGWDAGKEMIEAGMTVGYCLPHDTNTAAVMERCQGFEDAIAEAPNVTYGGNVPVPPDSMALFKTAVEEAVGEAGDWPGVGTLLTGRTMDDAINLHSYHPEMLIGSFDTSETLYDALENHTFLFGIDQEPYLQGYLPVVLLTWNAYTKQKLETFSIETGPRFVKVGPTPDKEICEQNIFKVCPEPEEFTLNQLTKVRPVGLAFAVIIWVTSIAFACWVIWNRKRRVVKASQPVFLLMICIGTFVMALTVIPLSIDDGIASDERCDSSCMATPWLFTLGLTITFAALFSKIRRVNKLMVSAQRFRRVKISERDVMIPFATLLTLNMIFLLVWTLVDPMIWKRKSLCGSGDLSSYGYCAVGSGNTSIAMFACVVALNVCALFLANYQAYKARSVSTEFGESQYVAIIMMSILQIVIIGVPLIFLLVKNPSASYFVRVGVIFVICMSTLLLMFVPKMLYQKKLKKDEAREQVRKQQRNSMPMDLAVGEGRRVSLSGYNSLGSQGLAVNFYCSGCADHARRDAIFHDQKIYRIAGLLKNRGIDAEEIFKEAGIPLNTWLDDGGNHQNRRSSQTNTLSLGMDVENLKKSSGSEGANKDGSCIAVRKVEFAAEECLQSISNENEKKSWEGENKGEPSSITGEETFDYLECKESVSDESKQGKHSVSFSDAEVVR